MNKKEILDGMSISELQKVIREKQKQEAIKKYSTKRETKFYLNEIDSIKSETEDNLFHIRVEDGSEGWEAIVEVSENVDYGGDLEDLVENHIINFIIDNEYYENGDIEKIIVTELCRYHKPFFKIDN